MPDRSCPDCTSVSDDTLDAAGKCSQCHGKGFVQGLVEETPEDIAGESRRCRACGGSGVCSTCAGRGFLESVDSTDSGLYRV